MGISFGDPQVISGLLTRAAQTTVRALRAGQGFPSPPSFRSARSLPVSAGGAGDLVAGNPANRLLNGAVYVDHEKWPARRAHQAYIEQAQADLARRQAKYADLKKAASPMTYASRGSI
jgi:hypothetical protein